MEKIVAKSLDLRKNLTYSVGQYILRRSSLPWLCACGHGPIDMLERQRRVCYCETKPKESNTREKESGYET